MKVHLIWLSLGNMDPTKTLFGDNLCQSPLENLADNNWPESRNPSYDWRLFCVHVRFSPESAAESQPSKFIQRDSWIFC